MKTCIALEQNNMERSCWEILLEVSFLLRKLLQFTKSFFLKPAHFHIPQEWINSTAMGPDVYLDLLPIAENEIDWPDMSAATGFRNSSYTGNQQKKKNQDLLQKK